MNKDQITGKFDQTAGKLKEKLGDAVGNEKLANSGAAQQVKGAAEETWGKVKDTASTAHDNASSNAAVEGNFMKQRAENAGHDLREKVTSTAHNLKDKIGNKLDEIKHEASRDPKDI